LGISGGLNKPIADERFDGLAHLLGLADQVLVDLVGEVQRQLTAHRPPPSSFEEIGIAGHDA
jgi:hypothetical protein